MDHSKIRWNKIRTVKLYQSLENTIVVKFQYDYDGSNMTMMVKWLHWI